MAATCRALLVAASSECYGKPLTTHTLPWALSSIHNKKSAGTGQGSAASVSTIDVTCKNRKIVAPMFESILVGSPGATRSVLVLTKKKEGQQHTIHASRFLSPLTRLVPYVPMVLLHLPRHVDVEQIRNAEWNSTLPGPLPIPQKGRESQIAAWIN